MGMLELENAVVPVTGKFITKRQRFETVSCVHCQAVIAVVHEGCSRTYQSDRRCNRCDGCICKWCEKQMHELKGECPGPVMAKIEYALKTGLWDNHHVHRYRGY